MLNFLYKYYYPPVHFWTLWFSEAMLYNIKKNGYQVNNMDKVVDIGCGLGYHCQNILKYYVNEVVGTDLSGETIELLHEFKTKVEFMKLDICKDDVSKFENHFSVAFSSDVYEHVNNPEVMLKNLYEILNKEGILCITFPNWENHGKNQFYRIDEFKEKLKKAGFNFYKIDIIKDYSIPYKLVMKLYQYVQKLSDLILRVNRVQYKGSYMPESDEFHEMYAYKKIQKIKHYKYLCVTINIIYRFICNILRVRPPYLISKDNINVINKRIIVFAKK